MQFLSSYIDSLKFLSEKFIKNKQIILVLIDDNTIKKIGDYPFKRSEYATVLAKILKGKPKVIGIDIFFAGIKDLEDDLKLIEVLDKTNTDIVLAFYSVEVEDLIINKIKAYSNRFYSYKDISAGNVEIFEAGDLRITKISAIPFIDRRYEKEYLPFPILIASKYRKADYKQKPLLDRGILVATIGDIEIPNPSDMLINYRGGIEAFDTISFEKIAETYPSMFRDKIVLIGASAESIKDHFVTPISKKTPGVIIHANIIDTILNKRFISEVDLYSQVAITFLICFAVSMLFVSVRPIISLLVSVSVLIASKIVVDFVFIKYRLYFLYSPLFFSVIFSYFGIVILSRRLGKHERSEAEKGTRSRKGDRLLLM